MATRGANPWSPKYPCTAEELTRALHALAEQMERVNGPGENERDVRCRQYWRVIKPIQDNGNRIGRMDKVEVHCARHNKTFTSNGRLLFNTSWTLSNSNSSCPECLDETTPTERKRGLPPSHPDRRYSIDKLNGMIAQAPNFPFLVDEDKVPDSMKERLLEQSEHVPLVCRGARPDGTPCGHTTTHRVGNIVYTLKNNPDHLHCQGPCRSSPRGYSTVKPLEEAKAELETARNGTWVLANDALYTGVTSVYRVVHVPCGNAVRRPLDEVIGYPNKYGLAPDNPADCPTCANTAFPVKGPEDLDDFARWLSVATTEHISVIDASPLLESSKNPIKVACDQGHEPFDKPVRRILATVYHGCKSCAEEANRQLRAWRLVHARELVARRGYTLLNDPESYTNPALICDELQRPSPYETILALLQALPMRADRTFGEGYKRQAQAPRIAEDSARHREHWTREEDQKLRELAAKLKKADVSAVLGRTHAAISQRVQALGINMRRGDAFRGYAIRENAFSEPSVDACYFAGLLATDGNIKSSGTSYKVSLELQAIDEAAVAALLRFIGGQAAVSYRTMKKIDGRGVYAGMKVGSPTLAADLARLFNVKPRKTYTMQPPALETTEQRLAFLCGLFDGDGGFKWRPEQTLAPATWNIVTASEAMAQWIAEVLKEDVGVIASIGTPKGVWIVRTTGLGAAFLLRKMRAIRRGEITRKWDKIDAFLNACDLTEACGDGIGSEVRARKLRIIRKRCSQATAGSVCRA